MTDFATTRRRLLTAAGATGAGLLTSGAAVAAADADQPVEGPPYNQVDSIPEALDYIEAAINDHTNRPTNSYVPTGDKAPQIAFDMRTVSESALRGVVRVAALAFGRAVASAAPVPEIQFRAYHAELGKPYRYAASFHFTNEMPLRYSSAVSKPDHISEARYLQWAYRQLKWR